MGGSTVPSVVRGVGDMMTMGSSEVARRRSGTVNDAMNTVEYGTRHALTGELPPGVGTPPAMPPDATLDSPPPLPAPMPTATSEISLKRRLMAMRMGLLSTIRTNPWGTDTTPNLLVPQAFASGLKTQLGQ